VMRNRN